LTACDPGAAATEAPNRALQALVFVASRDGLFAEILQQGLPVSVATCTADAVVRDAALKPLIDSATSDPSASPDDAVLSAVRARVPEILKDCSSKSA
jgi:hypothetical protein